VDKLESISDASQRLLELMTALTEGNHARYDVAILQWGQHEPEAKRTLKKVFDFRASFVRSIFEELGFKGDALEMRVHTMVFFQTMEGSTYMHLSKAQRLQHVKLRHAMLTA
jgi:hypothetical protein